MDYSVFYQAFVDAMKCKTCWGAKTVGPLVNQVLQEYQAEHGELLRAGTIVNVMRNYVELEPTWGRNQLARIMKAAIRKAEAQNA